MGNYTHSFKIKAFSFVELAMVIAIMAIIVAVVFPVYNNIMEDAKNAKLIHDLSKITRLIKNFYLDTGRWPIEINDMGYKYLPESLRIDPWYNHYTLWNYYVVSYRNDGGNIRKKKLFRSSRLIVLASRGSTNGIWESIDGGLNFRLLYNTGGNVPSEVYEFKLFNINGNLIFKLGSNIVAYNIENNTIKEFTSSTGSNLDYYIIAPHNLWFLDSSYNLYFCDSISSFRAVKVMNVGSYSKAPNNYVLGYIIANNHVFKANSGEYLGDFSLSGNRFYISRVGILRTAGSNIQKLNENYDPLDDANWQFYSSPSSTDIKWLWIIENTWIVILTNYQHYISYDYGKNWVSFDPANGPTSDGYITSLSSNGYEIWATNSKNKLFYSPDCGKSWRYWAEPYSSSEPFNSGNNPDKFYSVYFLDK